MCLSVMTKDGSSVSLPCVFQVISKKQKEEDESPLTRRSATLCMLLWPSWAGMLIPCFPRGRRGWGLGQVWHPGCLADRAVMPGVRAGRSKSTAELASVHVTPSLPLWSLGAVSGICTARSWLQCHKGVPQPLEPTKTQLYRSLSNLILFWRAVRVALHISVARFGLGA